MHEDFIDRVYEASFMPELWPSILAELGDMTDSVGGLLLATRDKTLSWTASGEIYPAFADYLSEGWFRRCGRRVCIIEHARSEFLREHDYWTEEEIEENEIYREFFRPRDLGCSAGTGLITPSGDAVVFSVERSHTVGPIAGKHLELLNELRPHLARSAMVAARMGLKNAMTAKDVFAKIGLPTLLLNRDGLVMDASAEIADMGVNVTIGAQNRLMFDDAEANALLASSLAAADGKQDDRQAVRSFPLKGADGCAVGVAHLLPIEGTANDLFVQGFAILVINPVNAKAAPAVSLLRSLFDLTASEARVARQLAKGQSVDEIAQSGNVSVNTVRTQLRKIMEKMGCSRQPEVVSLISNVALER